MTRRQYTDEERAEILAIAEANGGDLLATEKQTGVNRKTIEYWVKKKANPKLEKLHQEKREELHERLDKIVWMMTDGITEEKIKNSHVHHLTTAIGTLIDKSRLLKNQPTSITENSNTHTFENDEYLRAHREHMESYRTSINGDGGQAQSSHGKGDTSKANV